MILDLPTLLLVRLFLDGFVVALFSSFVRQHPDLGGPRWWAGAAIASALGTLCAASVVVGGWPLNVINVAGGLTAVTLSQAMIWLGLRRYLGLPMRSAIKWTAVVGGAMFLAQGLLLLVWDVQALRRALFIASFMGAVVLGLRLLRRKGGSNSAPEFGALRVLFRIELVILGVVLVRLLLSLSGEPVPLVGDASGIVVLFMTLDALVRTALLSALVVYQLQQVGERDRQRLRDGKADLRALLDNIHAGVIVLNPDKSIETINAAARRFLGRVDEEPAAAEPGPRMLEWDLLREDGQPLTRHEMPFELVLATGRPVTDVILGHQPKGPGDTRWALCNAFAENNHLGGLRHVVLTFVDITARQAAERVQKALQAQLSQSQKMQALGTLAGGVAHDFNNILAAILGNAELARQDADPQSMAVLSLNEISVAARRGRELVRQILAFSRQQPLERKRVSMRAILAESCSLLKPALPSHVKLGTACGPGDLSINADATQLGQVLLNLGTNALHAIGSQPGQLTIQVNRFATNASVLPAHLPKDWLGVIRVVVTDTGCGMDEETRQRIFEPFFTTRKLGSGTGLGLPVVLGIVEGHDGVIEVRSQPGEGTTFSLYFPAAVTDPGSTYVDSGWPQGKAACDNDTAHSSASAPVPTGTTITIAQEARTVENAGMIDELQPPRRHVLYLDDDDTLVFLVRRLLERRGFVVTSFTDQNEAIDAVRAQPDAFDLLMTDFNMPGMSGLDVARAVLAINPSLTVAVASGYITDELQSEAKAAGVKEVVFKTDAVEDFCAVVARLVDAGRT
jgi:two-component system, cell cycle sensor histidine kinase and response regulator CckA